jgi:hypothetical protein
MAAHADALRRAQIEVLKGGLIRQAGRDPVVEGVPMAFMLDAVGIFCIAIGAKAIADAAIIDDLGSWGAKFLRYVYEMEKTEDWERCLLAVAGEQLNCPHLAIPDSPAVADVRVVLAAKGFMNTTDTEAKDNAIRTLALGVLAPPTELNCDRTALRAAAVDAVIATVAGEFRLPLGLAPAEPRKTNTSASFPRLKTAPSPENRSDDATTAKTARANTVARLVNELNQLKPQMLEDESEYSRLREVYPDFLSFKIAEHRPDLKLKILAIRGSIRHIRLAQELASAHHGRQLSTIQDDWKDFKPPEFRRSH